MGSAKRNAEGYPRNVLPHDAVLGRCESSPCFRRIVRSVGEVQDCDEIHFLHIKRNRLYFVFSTKAIASLSSSFPEQRLSHILFRAAFKDCLRSISTRSEYSCHLQEYIGSLTEGGIRKNTTLIYELMHEIMVWVDVASQWIGQWIRREHFRRVPSELHLHEGGEQSEAVYGRDGFLS